MYLVGRVDDQVGPERQWVVEERRRPSAVDGHRDSLPMRCIRDGGQVLNFERQRSRRFQVDEFRARPEQAGDVPADARIIIFGLDAQPPEQRVAERAGRAIDAVHHEEMISRAAMSEQRGGDRRDPGWQDESVVASLEPRQRILERVRGRGPKPAIMEVAGIVPLMDRML
jgi:hypothetical protein